MNLDRYAAHKRWTEIAAKAGGTVPEKTGLSIRAEADTMTARITGVIDDFYGFSVKDLIARFDEEKPKNIVLLIESPGGSFVDGLALYTEINRLRSQGVTVRAEAVGLVASAATLPYFAATERVAHEGAMFMIHNVWTMFLNIGNADDLEAEAKQAVATMRKLDKRNTSIVSEAMGLTTAKAVAALKAETWYDTDEMVSAGIAAEVVKPPQDKKIKDHAMDAARALWMEMTNRQGDK